MPFHAHRNPGPAVIDAMMRGVELNNQGAASARREDFALAESQFLESLAIKQRAYPEESVHICITLSGLADLFLSWAQKTVASDSARGATLLKQARAYGERMQAAATHIRDPQQIRVARDILADISKAEAVERTPHGPAADSPPTHRCHNDACTTAPPLDLSMCARCERVYYCCKGCQKANWAVHKRSCVRGGR